MRGQRVRPVLQRGGEQRHAFHLLHRAEAAIFRPRQGQQADGRQPALLFRQFDEHEKECQRLLEVPLALPAYERMLKTSHTFNLLDARRAISVTERQRYILRVRTLARGVAEAYYQAREKLGFPLLRGVAP